jgi:hypothetical protein
VGGWGVCVGGGYTGWLAQSRDRLATLHWPHWPHLQVGDTLGEPKRVMHTACRV